MSTTPATTGASSLPLILSKALNILLGVGLGLGGIAWVKAVTYQIEASSTTGLGALLPFLVVCPAFLFAVTAHEIGHWLASRYAGFRCIGISVAWLHLERKAGRWRLRLGARPHNYWGFVQAFPLTFTAYRRHQAWFLVGGAAANLLSGTLALLAHYLWPSVVLLTAGASLSAFVLAQSVLLFGWISLLLGVANLLPSSPRTDGAKLLLLMQGGPAQRRQECLQQLISASYQGLRPRDWDTTLLQQLLATPDASATDCTAYLCAYAHTLDRQDFTTAWQHLLRALDHRHLASAPVQQHLLCEAAYFAAVLANAPTDAQRWFADAEQVQPFKPEQALFTRAALAYSRQDYAQARQLLERCYPEIAKTDDLGGRAQALDRFNQLRQFTEARIHPAPARSTSPDQEPGPDPDHPRIPAGPPNELALDDAAPVAARVSDDEDEG